MEVIDLLEQHFGFAGENIRSFVPASTISRQQWQEMVEIIVGDVRKLSGQSTFGLSEVAISVHYHSPVGAFESLVKQELGQE
jgi:hypothetical protein